MVKGVSITEVVEGKKPKDCPKIEDFFKKDGKLINGMPEADEKIQTLEGKKRSNAWKKYFMDVEEFLVDYTKGSKSIDEINVDDIEM
jgi:hypothetical protein